MHNLFNEKEQFLKLSPATIGEVGGLGKVLKVFIKEVVEAIVVTSIFDGDEK